MGEFGEGVIIGIKSCVKWLDLGMEGAKLKIVGVDKGEVTWDGGNVGQRHGVRGGGGGRKAFWRFQACSWFNSMHLGSVFPADH